MQYKGFSFSGDSGIDLAEEKHYHPFPSIESDKLTNGKPVGFGLDSGFKKKKKDNMMFYKEECLHMS